ncbi:indole-3-glycerol phosphate synthase TrpC [Sporolactobacillus shoreicorticis]|uniref:indole-3-glycerol-phosphate synthase n=1 Tax=Sporolactobacillus shoreicorticis TaxID=1923877 RepID=A0ABW5S3E5_9BACL|nr:indole-3-glycerol phosphate synthase TrpC [Sporolactobacillus shoreicorticis]MCO7127030.1 indole-3-glycerol phosphate synthase TrpC [Sporolactobacillus shoreicorticis]
MLSKIVKTKADELAVFSMPKKGEESIVHYSLKTALTNPNHKLGLIAEVKQASPSKGVFARRIVAGDVAEAYACAGADAISVLTDRTYFHGSIENLKAVKAKVQLPVLRKDFIIDKRQIEEAARCGADAILLIAAALDPMELHEFYLAAEERGMESLVEVHSVSELESVLQEFTPEIIGINNRNLRTFETRLSVTKEVAVAVPKGAVMISESGIRNAQDICYLLKQGAHAALVGEALICSDSPEEKIRELFSGSAFHDTSLT